MDIEWSKENDTAAISHRNDQAAAAELEYISGVIAEYPSLHS